MMFLYAARTRKLLYFIIITLITAVIAFLFWFKNSKAILINSDWKIQGLNTYSHDGYISVEWDMINASNLDSIQIEVKNDQDELLFIKKCDANTTSYKFNDGEHGTAYNFKVNLILSDGQIINSDVSRNVFLDYSCIADIPFFNINTIDGKELECKPVASPLGCWGIGTTDNEYRTANMSILSENNKIFDGDIEIRVRGNTSATAEKKPYRIKTSASVNLLDSKNTQYASKDWYLLPVNNFNLLAGTEVANCCGMEWQPRYCIVNVMFNGDYLGCYWVTEAISVGKYRCNIKDSGYLIECDAYWWNSNDEYFKIDNQLYATGYTFKYPSFSVLDKSKLSKIRNHLNEGIQYLRNNDERYMQYIDVNSWASWLLTHDILGTLDSGGSNLFYYKEDFKDSNPLSTKIKMGPVWDFDSIYLRTYNWSSIRSDEHGYFPLLIRQKDFNESYNKKWESLSNTLVDSVDKKINAFFEQCPQGIEHSLYLNSIRWGVRQLDIEKGKEKIHNWLVSRTEWLNNNIK